MNVGTLIGFFFAITVFGASVVMSFRNVGVIVDVHAGLIVLGGTIAVGLICFPLNQIGNLLRVFARRILGKNRRDYDALIKELVMLSEANRKGKKQFEAAIPSIKDAFLKDAANMIFWAKAEITQTLHNPPSGQVA